MRQHKPSAGRTESVRRKDEAGSIVVEASLVMPIIIIVLLVFVMLIRLCAVQMALHSAASQTVRQVAAHIHPADLVWQQSAGSRQQLSETTKELSEWSEVAASAAEWLPEPAGLIVSSALRGDFRPLQNLAATELGRTIVEPLLREFSDQAILSPDRLTLAWLTLPDLNKNNEPYLAIAVEYEFPLKLPFYRKPIILKEQAIERVWVSDAAAARYGNEGGETDSVPIQVVSISPSPLRPGRKATVVVKTAPGASISLGVKYKSGDSRARHLGEAVADENGYVQWTWHVSGNTTPGIWSLTATETGNQDNQVSMHFTVEKSTAAEVD